MQHVLPAKVNWECFFVWKAYKFLKFHMYSIHIIAKNFFSGINLRKRRTIPNLLFKISWITGYCEWWGVKLVVFLLPTDEEVVLSYSNWDTIVDAILTWTSKMASLWKKNGFFVNTLNPRNNIVTIALCIYYFMQSKFKTRKIPQRLYIKSIHDVKVQKVAFKDFVRRSWNLIRQCVYYHYELQLYSSDYFVVYKSVWYVLMLICKGEYYMWWDETMRVRWPLCPDSVLL